MLYLGVLNVVDPVVGHERGAAGEVLGVVRGPVSGQSVVVLQKKAIEIFDQRLRHKGAITLVARSLIGAYDFIYFYRFVGISSGVYGTCPIFSRIPEQVTSYVL